MLVHVRVVRVHVHVRADGSLDFVLRHLVHVLLHVHEYVHVHVCTPSHQIFIVVKPLCLRGCAAGIVADLY